MRSIFKQEIYVHNDYLIFPHHIPFSQMLSNQYISPTKFFRHIINKAPLEFYRNLPPLPWRLQNSGQWHENTSFGMLLSLYFNFGQKTLTSLPSALPQNMFIPPSSGQTPATSYTNYLKMFYLDVLSFH